MQAKALLPLIVFTAAIALSLATLPPWDTLSYDGALYIDIARNLAGSPTNFTYQGVYVMYRPPLYPYTLSLFYHFVHDPLSQLTIARLVSAVFFALTVVLVYILTLELFESETKGLTASLFFMFNPLAFTMGTRELVHSEFTFFYALAVYLFYKGRKRKSPKILYLAFISAGLAILTRYTGLSIIALFLAYLWLVDYWDWIKRREYLIGFGLLFLTLSPWLYLGHLHYGGAFKPFEIATRAVTADKPVSASDYIKLLLKDLGYILPTLSILGFVKQRQDEKGWLLISWAFLGFMMILTVTHKETRFVTFLAPVMGILAAEGVELIINGVERGFELRAKPLRVWRPFASVALALLLLVPVAGGALHLKDRWNITGKYESHVLRYASEHYPAKRLLVSPYLYTMAGFYYPGARVEMILCRKDVEEKISEGYYDVIIHKNPNTYLNIITSGKYKLVREFYNGKFKIFIKTTLGVN